MVYFLPYPDLKDQLVFMSVGLYASLGTVKNKFLLINTSLSLSLSPPNSEFFIVIFSILQMFVINP